MITEKVSLWRIFVRDFSLNRQIHSESVTNQAAALSPPTMIKAVVIVQDMDTLQLATATIASMCTNVEIAGYCDSITTGIAIINTHQPDLVLLEVQLADGSGFDLLKHFGSPDFKIIIFSSYMEYAVKAIKYNAVDYLLKPLDAEELVTAVNKASDRIGFEERLQHDQLKDTIRSLNRVEKITLKTSEQLYLVSISDIVHVEADGNYSTFYLCGGKKLLVSKPLMEYDKILIDKGFFRIHKSYLINLNHMSHFDKKDGGFVMMSNGIEVPVASRKRDLLFELFSEQA
jgi:two-component system, LytTR family, response regulator